MLETKSVYPLGVAPTFTRPPIARVAAESAAEAALRDLGAEMAALRAEGRVVLRLPLGVVDETHLLRDRLAADPDQMAELLHSLRTHGQRSPIEVAELGPGRFGLISGWRRLMALRALAGEGAGFDSVLALVRSPDSAAEAYVAMVEENEIRAGLSYWERARVVVRAVGAGVFASEKQALQRLFASASRAKRSKIGSFVAVVQALDGVLRFPAALPERAGLALAQGLERDAGLAGRLAQALADPVPVSAAEEQARIAAALSGRAPVAPTPRRVLAPGVWAESAGAGRLVLGGPGLDAALIARLEAWIAAGGPG
jgi:hypothetical protein